MTTGPEPTARRRPGDRRARRTATPPRWPTRSRRAGSSAGPTRARSTRRTRPGRWPTASTASRSARTPTSWTCSRTRPAPGCTSATRWATSAPTSTPATAACAATTSCTRWASTRSACRPSSTRSRPASTRAPRPTPTSTSSWRQLRRLGLGHDERRRVATTDPQYYRWTQWIFLQIFNSWYDTAADQARPIDELIAELDAGARAAGARAPTRSAGRGPSCPTSSGARSSTTTGWPTAPSRWSTGRPGWAPCCPTRRSPPTGAASAATSRCSAGRCRSG